ncbi:four helix bundle protein [Flavobacteriaceae bacterium R38]|nr:four helix bundle protein [Flavobacteriaceae bacterium R38]
MYQYYFGKLDVWKLSIDMCLKIYSITADFPNSEKFGITSQLRRAITSVPTNLVEGLSRDSYKDQARFSTISYGSLMESLNLLILASRLEYINEETYTDLRKDLDEISNKINALKNSQLSRIKN